MGAHRFPLVSIQSVLSLPIFPFTPVPECHYLAQENHVQLCASSIEFNRLAKTWVRKNLADNGLPQSLLHPQVCWRNSFEPNSIGSGPGELSSVPCAI